MGELQRALGYYQKLVAGGSSSPTVLYNLAQTHQSLGNHAEALAGFNRVLSLEPGDWQARAKVIQELQALGRLPERDTERRLLIDQRSQGADPELAATAFYCREQFTVGNRKVFALEHFELVGQEPRLYEFQIFDASSNSLALVLSLGSNDFTTNVMRETGKLGPNERAYHLDSYSPDGLQHATYRFFDAPPSYDETRAIVLEILAGTIEPVSSTSLPAPETVNVDQAP
jgi:tetratricopeptide (TPR) repeat protein